MNIVGLASQMNVGLYACISNTTHDDIIHLNNNLYFLHLSSIYVAGVFGMRHFQTFLMFLGLTLAYAMRVNMSVAIVAMTDKNAANPDFDVRHVCVHCALCNMHCLILSVDRIE